MKKLIRKLILWSFKEEAEDFEVIKSWVNYLNKMDEVTRRRINRLYDELNLEHSKEMSSEEWTSNKFDVFNLKKEKTMKYISINDNLYKVKKEYTENNSHYIIYNDPSLKSDNLTEYLGIYLKDRAIINEWSRWDRHRLNLWNPLTYIYLLFVVLFNFTLDGVNGIKEMKNPFKPFFDKNRWYDKNEIEILDIP